jgi:rSAM/selenodomain-associated transferase 1
MSAGSPVPVTVAVMAKEPVAGRVKTRLCPPCTPDDAAAIARAALTDTIDAALASAAARVVVVLDGRPGQWLPDGVDVVVQRGGGLDERLGRATVDVGGPLVIIVMDTPQVTPDILDEAMARLVDAGTDAVFGPADDGGYWGIGLRVPDPALFRGVPMSTADTGREQLASLERRGLSVRTLRTLRDVDTFDDALAVAASAGDGRFVSAVVAVEARLAAATEPVPTGHSPRRSVVGAAGAHDRAVAEPRHDRPHRRR